MVGVCPENAIGIHSLRSLPQFLRLSASENDHAKTKKTPASLKTHNCGSLKHKLQNLMQGF